MKKEKLCHYDYNHYHHHTRLCSLQSSGPQFTPLRHIGVSRQNTQWWAAAFSRPQTRNPLDCTIYYTGAFFIRVKRFSVRVVKVKETPFYISGLHEYVQFREAKTTLQTNLGTKTGPYQGYHTLPMMFAVLCKRVWSFESSARFFSGGRVWPWIEPAGERDNKRVKQEAGARDSWQIVLQTLWIAPKMAHSHNFIFLHGNTLETRASSCWRYLTLLSRAHGDLIYTFRQHNMDRVASFKRSFVTSYLPPVVTFLIKDPGRWSFVFPSASPRILWSANETSSFPC